MRQRSRERVLRILRREGDGEVSYDALGGMAETLEAAQLAPGWREYFLTGEVRYVSLEPPGGSREVFGEYVPDLPPEAELSCWGVGRVALKSVEGHHAGHKCWPPLASVDSVASLESYPFANLSTVKTLDALRDEVQALQRDGFAAIGQMSQTILETAYLMRGIDRLMVDLVERPEYVDTLFGKLGEQRITQARLFAQAGVDAIRIGDDIATQQGLMVGPRMYRQRIRPHHAAAIAAAREVIPDLPVSYHSDGRLTALLPDLIDIGVTAINPVQPECMDLMQVKREFGAHLTLWGCTPVQSLYARGRPEDVRAHTRFLFEQVARDYGLIIQFMNIVLTPTVLANLQAFFGEFACLG
jgi:uroporphyrinogen decarboxylase